MLDFYHKMTRIHQEIVYDRDLHTLMARIAQLEKDDVVIVISYSGRDRSRKFDCQNCEKTWSKNHWSYKV